MSDTARPETLVATWNRRQMLRMNSEHGDAAYNAGQAKAYRECADELEAALTAGGWQEISSAPKDGTPILGCRPTWTHPYVFCYLNGPGLLEGWHDFNISADGRRPHDLTHWMLLPSAPTETP